MIRLVLLACCMPLVFAAHPKLARELDEVARVASFMVDGDVCERIMTPRAVAHFLKEDPRDQWAVADNFDVNHDAYISTKKTLIRLSLLAPKATDVNLWMPVPGDSSRVHIVIRNANELSQFWKWGELHQPPTQQMKDVMATGRRITVPGKMGILSVLAPVSNSLGDIVGFVEVVSQPSPDPHANVK